MTQTRISDLKINKTPQQDFSARATEVFDMNYSMPLLETITRPYQKGILLLDKRHKLILSRAHVFGFGVKI